MNYFDIVIMVLRCVNVQYPQNNKKLTEYLKNLGGLYNIYTLRQNRRVKDYTGVQVIDLRLEAVG